MFTEEKLLNNYTLRSKDIPLIRFSLYGAQEIVHGVIRAAYQIRIDEVFWEQGKLFPKGLQKNISSEGLRKWIQKRKAPKNRQFVDKIMMAIEDDNNPLKYVDITHALSLNDAFWITNDLAEQKWRDFNLYQNKFDEILANVAFTGYTKGYTKKISGVLTTPELTTCGALKKCWSNRADGIYLLKGDDFVPRKDGRSQVTNEYYAAQVAECLGLPYVPYDLEKFKHRDGSEEIVCICRLFTTENIGAYKGSLSGKYLSFDQKAQLFAAKRHLPALGKLKTFTFTRHPQYNIAEETLLLMEDFIRERAVRAMEYVYANEAVGS